MVTPKSWTAADVKMGTLRLSLDDGGVLHAIQGYSFVNNTSAVVPELPERTVQMSVVFADLPQEIQAALATVNNYMYTRALNMEGME